MPENSPPNGAGGGGIKDSDAYRKEPDPAADERVDALTRIFDAAVAEFGDDGAWWFSNNSHDLTGDPDLWIKAVRESRMAQRAGTVIRSLPGFIKQKHHALAAGPAPARTIGVFQETPMPPRYVRKPRRGELERQTIELKREGA